MQEDAQAAVAKQEANADKVGKAAQKITEEVTDESANIIFGSAFDSSMEGQIRVSIVATGIEEATW